MTRNFTAVLADVIGTVPVREIALRSALVSLGESARYRAPEQSHFNWRALEEILASEIGKPTEDWHWTIVEIVTNKARGES